MFHRALRGAIVKSEAVGADGAPSGALQTTTAGRIRVIAMRAPVSDRLVRGVRDLPPKRSDDGACAAPVVQATDELTFELTGAALAVGAHKHSQR